MKPWYTSKTLWFNMVAAALIALEGVTGLLQPYMPVNFYVAMCVGLPVINAVLRAITDKRLTA